MSNFAGDPETYVSALMTLALLEADGNGTLSIHDWETWNRYRFGAEARSERARKASDARWNPVSTPSAVTPSMIFPAPLVQSLGSVSAEEDEPDWSLVPEEF